MKYSIKNLSQKLKFKFQRIRYATSISDNRFYPDFCAKASMNSTIFSSFRRNFAYCQILEHVSQQNGEVYLDIISKNYSYLLQSINNFKENDRWGNPLMFEYPEIGQISPTTLRYVKVLGELNSLFNNLNGLKICEIGVGYGGQCRIIHNIASLAEYTLVDIKPALMLAQCYLDKFPLNSVLKYKTMNELEGQPYDLIISNYAFTELPRIIQDIYLSKIILNSKKGYITYNEISPAYFQSYRKEELLKLIPNSYIIEEKPLTHEKNCIIVWGTN